MTVVVGVLTENKRAMWEEIWARFCFEENYTILYRHTA